VGLTCCSDCTAPNTLFGMRDEPLERQVMSQSRVPQGRFLPEFFVDHRRGELDRQVHAEILPTSLRQPRADKKDTAMIPAGLRQTVQKSRAHPTRRRSAKRRETGPPSFPLGVRVCHQKPGSHQRTQLIQSSGVERVIHKGPSAPGRHRALEPMGLRAAALPGRGLPSAAAFRAISSNVTIWKVFHPYFMGTVQHV